MASISHVVLVSWKSGKQIHAEELVRPSVRGFVGTIPGVLVVVEGTPPAQKGWRTATTTASSSPSPRRRRVTPYLNDSNHRPVAEAIGAAAERIVVFDI